MCFSYKVSEGRNACSMRFQICREHTWICGSGWIWCIDNLLQSEIAIAHLITWISRYDNKVNIKELPLEGPWRSNFRNEGVSACPTAWLDASDPCRSDSPLAKLTKARSWPRRFSNFCSRFRLGLRAKGSMTRAPHDESWRKMGRTWINW